MSKLNPIIPITAGIICAAAAAFVIFDPLELRSKESPTVVDVGEKSIIHDSSDDENYISSSEPYISPFISESFSEPNVNVDISGAVWDLPEEITELLSDYLTEKYCSLGSLEYRDLSGYFNTSTRRGAVFSGFNNASLELLLHVRRRSAANLSFSSANIEVNIDDYERDGDVYTVHFYIDDEIYFALSDTPSCSYNMEIIAELQPNALGEYLLLSFYEETDVNYLVEQRVFEYINYIPDYDDTIENVEIPEDINLPMMFSAVNAHLRKDADRDILEVHEALSAYRENAEGSRLTAKNEYNRDDAVEYSYNYISDRNDEYSDYGIYGGNCQNYVSQCLFAGGIPMDYSGTEMYTQWKWYDDEINDRESDYGRTTSWAGTESFFNYCGANTGSGLVSDLNANLFSGEAGDVIQYLVDGESHHSVIITKVIYDENGEIVDYLINSNTTDRKDFPMSAYGYTEVRLIKIIGSN